MHFEDVKEEVPAQQENFEEVKPAIELSQSQFEEHPQPVQEEAKVEEPIPASPILNKSDSG